jgi:hypothetical protein
LKVETFGHENCMSSSTTRRLENRASRTWLDHLVTEKSVSTFLCLCLSVSVCTQAIGAARSHDREFSRASRSSELSLVIRARRSVLFPAAVVVSPRLWWAPIDRSIDQTFLQKRSMDKGVRKRKTGLHRSDSLM